jgi:hypothetical protein
VRYGLNAFTQSAVHVAGRVWNVLEPSRSIGDVDLKGGAMEGGVIAAPDVCVDCT